MKKFLYIATFASSLFFGSSCVDLTQEPLAFITEEEYIASMDADALEKAVTALYKDLWQGNYGFNCFLQRLSVSADETAYSPTKANNPLDNYGRLIPNLSANDADFTKAWECFYLVINNANKYINHASLEGKTTDEVSTYEKLLGEAYFVRGLSYFYLVRLFGEAPLVLTGTDAKSNMPRASVAELYEKAIIPSLEKAADWLPEKSRSGFSSTPSKWAAKACLADAYVTMAGWPLKKTEYYGKAATLTKEVIDKKVLSLSDNYSDLWLEAKKEEANEHLFGVHHSAKLKVASNYGKSYYPKDFYPNSGWSDYYASEAFYLAYPNDDRKTWNFMTEWDAGTTANHSVINYKESVDKLPAISKYYNYDEGAPGKSAQANGITCIYRYADILLLHAEASTRATGTVTQSALDALNKVQNRSHSPIVTTTQNAAEFEKAVSNERGWEFFAEMRRWFELVRLEQVSVMKPEAWPNSLFKANNHYYFPVPSQQIMLTGWSNNAGY